MSNDNKNLYKVMVVGELGTGTTAFVLDLPDSLEV